jgi:carboxylesterase type B
MVFINGIGFYGGSTSMPDYDGTMLALKGDVVVVSFDYRLGPLGFLSLDDDSARGNYGLLDQQLALQWVHDNIDAFGGDPTRVTLFGSDAGGGSISLHLMSPGSKPLFRSAIIGSNVATGPYMFADPAQLKSFGIQLAKQVDCETESTLRGREVTLADIVQCLRGKDAEQLTRAQWSIPIDGSMSLRFLPTVDGRFLTKKPLDVVAANEFQNKSVIMGFDEDEGNFFVLYDFPDVFDATKNDQPTVNDTEFRRIIQSMSPMNPS